MAKKDVVLILECGHPKIVSHGSQYMSKTAITYCTVCKADRRRAQ